MVLEILLIIAFLSATSIQMYYWLFRFSAVLTPKSDASVDLPYTILICAHNEAENLAANLPLIAKQDLAPAKIIVVDHGSTDNTAGTLDHLLSEISSLEVVSIARETPAKKEALAVGLKHVKTDLLLLTDADCIPGSSQWAQRMLGSLGDRSACIGLGPLRGGQNLGAHFAEYESILSAFQYGAMAARGKAYMAIGRNLAYHTDAIRSRFSAATKGYLGGDDDLMINALRKEKTLAYCGDPMASTYSKSPSSLVAFMQQKRRHVSSSRAYDLGTKAEIFLFASSHWFHYLFLLGMLVFGMAKLGLLIYAVRLVVLYCRYLRTGVTLHGTSLLPWIPILDFLYSLYYPMLTFFLMIKPTHKW